MALSIAEREAFLAEPHIGSLAVARPDADRAPLVVPIWYVYQPGGDLWVVTAVDSVKARLLAGAGRFSLLAERVTPTIRYVSVEGAIVSTAPTTKDEMRTVAARYLPPAALEAYLELSAREYGPQQTVRMRPEHWLSADLGSI
ncbi:pyridoxamine 5-phosphate oxidase [Streptomyces venezuelae]|uniref:Pyridoxamine 5-phosphate oxidase n=1 Tax=Streptomyces venezuelae TaxID=54571 RepID=A0A5P2DB08_STRVZ|nr:pyridoxamine 5'-phosphate oxidase family protein [Streptomyces venezuelae]QES51720.1 pyridoxamine 5-phosphate oxidase [Streptomyces venezuelae]